jgi:TRAP-type mannitol/chloroaromatic compound transport system permease large subunit
MSEQQRLGTNADPTAVTRVRQGVVSFRVISILIVSTCLTLAVIGVIWLGFAPHDHHGVGQANPAPAKTSSS